VGIADRSFVPRAQENSQRGTTEIMASKRASWTQVAGNVAGGDRPDGESIDRRINKGEDGYRARAAAAKNKHESKSVGVVLGMESRSAAFAKNSGNKSP